MLLRVETFANYFQSIDIFLDLLLAIISLILSVYLYLGDRVTKKNEWSLFATLFSVGSLLFDYVGLNYTLILILSGFSLYYFMRALNLPLIITGKTLVSINLFIATSCGIGRIIGGLIIEFFLRAFQTATTVNHFLTLLFPPFGLIIFGGALLEILNKKAGHASYYQELGHLEVIKRFMTSERLVVYYAWALGFGTISIVNRSISIAIVIYLLFFVTKLYVFKINRDLKILSAGIKKIKETVWRGLFQQRKPWDTAFAIVFFYDSMYFFLMLRFSEPSNYYHIISIFLIVLLCFIDYYRTIFGSGLFSNISSIFITSILLVTVFFYENPLVSGLSMNLSDTPHYYQLFAVQFSPIVVMLLLLHREILALIYSALKRYSGQSYKLKTFWSKGSDSLLIQECSLWLKNNGWNILSVLNQYYLCAMKGTQLGFTAEGTEHFIEIQISEKVSKTELMITDSTEGIISHRHLSNEVRTLINHLNYVLNNSKNK